MDMSSISGVASVAANLATQQTQTSLGVAVLNEAINAQADGAIALIENIDQAPNVPPSDNLLGQTLDVMA